MENLKLCEIITSGDYGSMTDLTDSQRNFVALHTEICRKGAYVVSGMVEFAEKLKESGTERVTSRQVLRVSAIIAKRQSG